MKIAALVSGGVDSSVALKLLKDAGHDVTAFYLKIWLEDELASLGSCPWEEDLSYVEAVCKKLDVPLSVLSLQEDYHNTIVSYTISEIKAGRTPNPDVLCNQQIKFGAFFDKIDDSFEKIATGHYAQVIEQNGRFMLHRAPDPIKDQTYFLCSLSQRQLSRALFPIGHLAKAEVRALAEEFNLPTKQRKDSQGLCFLGKIKFSDFVGHHLGEQEGDIVEYETGKKLGTHHGSWYYTIGQRSGLKLSGGPWYVVAKDHVINTVKVSNHYEAINEKRESFDVARLEWVEQPTENDRVLVKVRHRSTPTPCTLTLTDATSAHVTLSKKDQGIAPGQFAVFYIGDRCIGSGIIA